VTTREAAERTGISERYLKVYTRKGWVNPPMVESICGKMRFEWREADLERAISVWKYRVEEYGRKSPKIAKLLREVRAKKLAQHGLHTNRIGESPLAA
jgi:DNA-binding transcriptional MerR regulator